MPVGRVVYTSMLNPRGGIETDLTVTRVDGGSLPARHRDGRSDSTTWAGSGSTSRTTARSSSNDVTSGRVCFGLWGPRARDLLAPLTTDDVSERGVPVPDRTADHDRAGAGVRAARHLRRGAGLGAVRADGVRRARSGTRSGRRAGSTASSPPATGRSTRSGSRRATGSGRATSRPDETPYEAGLGFAVKLDKEAEFIGRDALVAAKAAGPRKRLRCLVLDDDAGGLPRQRARPSRRRGRRAGDERRAGYAVERSIAYAYLPPDAAIGTRGEVAVFGEWIGFEVAREPLYDPAGERLRS